NVSGGHLASIDAVRRGEADLAAVDAVTHALLTRHAPERLAGTRVLAYSPMAPGLPYVTRNAASLRYIARLRAALATAAADPALAWARDVLLLDGFEVLSRRDYQVILAMEHAADARGVPVWS